MDYRELFEYRDGDIYWIVPSYRGFSKTGKRAGTLNKGYLWVRSKLIGRVTAVHRIVWSMFYGPIDANVVIDHIDRDPLNNRIENLRIATKSQNSQNAKGKSGKKSGLPKNVMRDWTYKGRTAYRVQICKDGVVHRIGNLSLEDATKAAPAFRAAIFGEYAYHPEYDIIVKGAV